jgi:hypothetical protein
MAYPRLLTTVATRKLGGNVSIFAHYGNRFFSTNPNDLNTIITSLNKDPIKVNVTISNRKADLIEPAVSSLAGITSGCFSGMEFTNRFYDINQYLITNNYTQSLIDFITGPGDVNGGIIFGVTIAMIVQNVTGGLFDIGKTTLHPEPNKSPSKDSNEDERDD